MKQPAQNRVSLKIGDIVRQPQSDQVNFLRKLNKKLQCNLDSLRLKLGSQKEFFEQLTGAVVAEDPFPRHHYTGVVRNGVKVVPVLVLSDWHIGEEIREDEVEGFNRFNWSVASGGTLTIVDEFLKWVEVNRANYCIEQCAVFCEGDYVSGDIHDELKATNEFPLPVQTAKAGQLLGEVLRILSGHFKRVDVWECGADNHGRLQRKPQAKQKSSNNMSYLVHAIARASTERCKNIVFHSTEGMKLLADVNGKKFLLEHGDALRGWAGLPFYAFARSIGREASRRMHNQMGFHFYVLGHFHTPCFIEGKTIVNGSLSGTSEFDHSCGRHADPCQVAFMVHPKYGVFNFTPFLRKR